jgi:drug/metabolite transporter (DMT)-like permease
VNESGARIWPAALAAVSGSLVVGFMPMLARFVYADGIGPSSMLLWRYALALLPLAAAIAMARLDFVAAWRRGAWRIAAIGMTLGAAQTLCFWESIKTLETSVAVLLFYTYPAITLALDRLVFKQKLRPIAVLCVAVILLGAALITGPGLRGGTIDLRGLLWALPSPFTYAVYLAVVTIQLRRYPPLIGGALLYLGMGATFGVAASFAGLDVPHAAGTWLLLAFIAIGPGALTITLFSYSAPRLGPSSYAIIANTELVTVVAVGILLLGEAVTPARLIGGALIVAGIATHGLSRGSVSARRTLTPSPPVGGVPRSRRICFLSAGRGS